MNQEHHVGSLDIVMEVMLYPKKILKQIMKAVNLAGANWIILHQPMAKHTLIRQNGIHPQGHPVQARVQIHVQHISVQV